MRLCDKKVTTMNIVLINLTRFGDLLQSQAAITDLASRGHRVGVVCLENFAGVASLLSHVSYVSALPSAGLLAALDRDIVITNETAEAGTALAAPEWAKALASLASWKAALISAFPVDSVCNLTPTLSARLLARFVAGTKPCTGFAVDEHGFGYSGNGWAAFLQGAGASRGVSPYNVVDLFRMVARGALEDPAAQRGKTAATSMEALPRPSTPLDDAVLSAPGDATLCRPGAAAIARMRERLDAEAPEGCAGFVALQLGASGEARRWPVSSFRELGERLWREERLCPVLLGSPQEQVLAQRYQNTAAHPSISLCGQTSLEDLAAALCCAKLLVTNDTGTMHLAAGLAVPVLSIFLATAQPFDTGPYRAGSCSVEPDLACHPCPFGTPCPHEYACRRAVSSAFMADLALSFLRSGEWRIRQSGGGKTGLEQSAPCTGGRVWISAPDAEGFMSLRSLSGHGGEDRTLWLQLLRHSIRQFIDRTRTASFQLTLPTQNCTLSEAEQSALTADLERMAALIAMLVQQGKALLQHPLAPLKEKFLRSWERVHAAFTQSPRLGALAVIWLEETQAEGQELPEILTVMEQFAALLFGLKGKITDKI